LSRCNAKLYRTVQQPVNDEAPHRCGASLATFVRATMAAVMTAIMQRALLQARIGRR